MATTEETQTSNRLSDRLRNGLALAQTRIQTMEERAKSQWVDLPTQLREALDRAFARIRTTLDLPSRADVSDLMERIEALDRKIGALEKRQGKRVGAGASATAQAAASEEPVEAEFEAAEGASASVAEDEQADAEDATKATARKTLPGAKGTSANKTLKASGADARPVKNGDNRTKGGKPRSKHGKGGKG